MSTFEPSGRGLWYSSAGAKEFFRNLTRKRVLFHITILNLLVIIVVKLAPLELFMSKIIVVIQQK